MKVKELMAALSKADPELTVCQFTKTGAEEIEDVGIFRGHHSISMAPKLVLGHADDEYVGFGNPGDFEVTALVENCGLICDLSNVAE